MSFFSNVLAVKMASVADTALNHHSLTHSLCTWPTSSFMAHGWCAGKGRLEGDGWLDPRGRGSERAQVHLFVCLFVCLFGQLGCGSTCINLYCRSKSETDLY